MTYCCTLVVVLILQVNRIPRYLLLLSNIMEYGFNEIYMCALIHIQVSNINLGVNRNIHVYNLLVLMLRNWTKKLNWLKNSTVLYMSFNVTLWIIVCTYRLTVTEFDSSSFFLERVLLIKAVTFGCVFTFFVGTVLQASKLSMTCFTSVITQSLIYPFSTVFFCWGYYCQS